MDYSKLTKKELLEKLENSEQLVEAQDILIKTLEDNKLSTTKDLHDILLDSFSTFETKYNLINPAKTILFKLERLVGQCEPQQVNGATVVAKAQLQFSVTERQVLTGKSQTYVLQCPTFCFHDLNQIEDEGWEEILYKELLRGFTQCVLQVFQASKK